MRLLTLSDSDSYLKWAVALTAATPSGWAVRHLVLDNVIAPSPAQVEAVQRDYPGRPIRRVAGAALARTVRRLAPEVVLVAGTGPAVEAVVDLLRWGGVLGADRPVLATGLPGISFPANELAAHHRRAFDLMILHSHRERADYAEVIARLGRGPALALARLPFLASTPVVRPGGREVVFAAQSLVPPHAGQRRAVLGALAELPTGLTPVVKVRALAGERQAHNEALPYAGLWAQMEQRRPIEFRAGSMAGALRDAAGFATVSSTAALEALAAGVPCLVIDEFGVSGELINTVFEGSGLLGGLDRLAAGDFARPRSHWLQANYFHPPGDDDWVESLEALVAERRAGALGAPGATTEPAASAGAGTGPADGWPTRLRRQVRVLPPAWVWRTLRRIRTRSG
ncbi:MAG: hypothetical protein Q4F67_03780 [Propionibacteriaceae bacterium]|nr:hypothetical protein [Propionibacteriaceae bacterium]